MSTSSVTPRKAVVLAPGQGRAYPMGRISAIFKADEGETQSRYSVSEWWLEPKTQGARPHSHAAGAAHSLVARWWLEQKTQGPGPHSHAEDDLFYVIEGVMSILGVRMRSGPSFAR